MSALDDLAAEYQRKASREGFTHLGDASEALASTTDYALRNWLRDFILRWETVEAIDAGKVGPDGSDAVVMAKALVAIMAAGDERARFVARETLAHVMRGKR